ncbi:hypothetical protein ABVK25_006551 [Lepraria finkii]|uniref:Uncharacterized protein n=1 Tax=Lepraria finkii TaxID=1340010 RepID=A0ABR4B852_9LECA
MSRHNRRHTRGHKVSHPDHQFQSDSFAIPSLSTHLTTNSDPKLSLPRHPRRNNDVSARHWHNRYLAWQARERKQKEERERLEEEQRRIFGGDGLDAADDEGLCGRMMDYFTGLDYLEGE